MERLFMELTKSNFICCKELYLYNYISISFLIVFISAVNLITMIKIITYFISSLLQSI